jgi:hypothetical protein
VRVGVFYGSPYYLRFYESALGILAERRHTLVLSCPSDRGKAKPPRALRGSSRVEIAAHPPGRGDELESFVRLSRTARDALRFVSPDLATAHANRARAFDRLAEVSGADIDTIEKMAGALDEKALPSLRQALAEIEALVPADLNLVDFVNRQHLDVAVVISRFNIGSAQTDIIKAARAAGIPCGVIAYSWDNLSNKGLLHVAPDRLYVWNEVQADEARRLHGMADDRVVVTGASRFDDVFAAQHLHTRDAVCDRLNMDPDKRLILYVGSSTFVAPRETEFVDRWIAAIRGASDGDVSEANVIVRPHPGTLKESGPWRLWQRPDVAGVAVAGPGFPPDQSLVEQIAASDAVVGLNTSAELEAAILDKPVLTVAAGDAAPGQEGSIHFRYLIAEAGTGAVTAAATLDDHVTQLAEALRTDPLSEARRRFVEVFLRPRGLGVEVSPLLADAIEELGRETRRPVPFRRALSRSLERAAFRRRGRLFG